MFDINKLITIPPFSLKKKEKQKIMEDALFDLTYHHYKNCSKYQKILDGLNYNPKKRNKASEIPFITTNLFKNFELKSINKNEIIKTITSSGTSNSDLSKIFLDRLTATNQTKVLTKIVSSVLGNKRLPMIIIDTEESIANRNFFSARGAAIKGFSIFGNEIIFALDKNLRIKYDVIKKFCKKHNNEKIFVFGFTFIIFKNFIDKLLKTKKFLPLSKSVLIHGGGWKKLIDESVTNNKFKNLIKKTTGIKRVYNYYGMVEQTGSILLECDKGNLHSSIYSDVIIRNNDFSECKIGQKGLVQLISVIPQSYPGHVILSEDIGELLGEDNCKCGLKGKYFKIHGRVKNAEIRGCSDAYE